MMEQEASYLAMLTTANRITLVNNQLVIGTPGGLLVYYNQPVPVLPTEPPAAETPLPSATVTPKAPTATPEAPVKVTPTATPRTDPAPGRGGAAHRHSTGTDAPGGYLRPCTGHRRRSGHLRCQ